MTPLARVEAAILRLETLKADSTPGPWENLRDSDSDLGFGPIMESLVTARDDDSVLDWGSGVREPDATLIVTLHVTIDPILDYLRDDAKRMKVEQNQDGIPLYYRHSLALADAINAGGAR